MTNYKFISNNIRNSLVLFLSFIIISCSPNKEKQNPRVEFKINDDWEFITEELTAEQSFWKENENVEIVSLPHTWNKNDLLDSSTYKRAKFQYNKKLILDNKLIGKRVFLYFEAVNQIADIYINSKFIQQHKGGYNAFTVEITDNVLFGNGNDNIISVVVDNQHNKNIPPLSADFNFYGGIYRDVWLIATNQAHFSLSKFGSKGIYISTPKVTESEASVQVKGIIKNQTDSQKELIVVNTITDKNGKEIASFETKLNINAHEEANFTASENIEKPKLWSPNEPNLYTVYSELFENGKLIDKVANPLGFRFYSFDAQKGLFLNGKHIKLMGSNRHQDFTDFGSAVPDSIRILDLKNAKKAGFNFIRLAHYPQSSIVLNKADELGLIIWEEILISITIIPLFYFGDT
ncbi:MAG: hypothetical protein B6I20_11280 [Bacteroidetes bacterium 4572_117]|nr:MAG: hypothetical protein B6I20_11280 [Bacteroidetes bacterium 4572_117]